MKRRYTIVAGLLISLVMLVLVLHDVDLNRVRLALTQADYGYVIPAAIILALSLLTRAVRWRVLLSWRLPLRHAFSILSISYLLNGTLPFRMGEVARLFLTTRVPQPVSAFTTLSSIVVERLFDVLIVIGMLGIVLAVLPVPGTIVAAGLALGVTSLGGLVALILVARYPARAFRILAWMERPLPFLRRWPLERYLGRFLDGLAVLTSWRSGLLAISWSLISWGLSVAAGYVLMAAFFPQPSWTVALFFVAMASLAITVPYAPGAVGTFEAAVVLALSLTGYNQPEGSAVAFAIVLHVMNTSVHSLAGIAGLLHEGVTLGQVMRGAQDVSAPPPVIVESE